jgi:tripartite-type tricarboxylate transporter receptor subunit TctC
MFHTRSRRLGSANWNFAGIEFPSIVLPSGHGSVQETVYSSQPPLRVTGRCYFNLFDFGFAGLRKRKASMNAFRRCSLVLLASVWGLLPLSAWSQNYPTKPIRVIIPFSPGGVQDQIVQLVGPKLTEAWGQQVLMDHRPGAGGVIGNAAGAKAAPDGYTLLMGNFGPTALAPSLYARLPYDPVKDFAAITLAITLPDLLLVHPSVPANTVREFTALARAKPGQLTFSSSGAGSSSHLAAELLKMMAGIDLVHVPYKGTMPALTDTMSGQVQVIFVNVGPALPFVKAGKLKALGVTSAKRTPVVPDLHTLAESGLPGYEIIPWVGFFAPAGTPKDITPS